MLEIQESVAGASSRGCIGGLAHPGSAHALWEYEFACVLCELGVWVCDPEAVTHTSNCGLLLLGPSYSLRQPRVDLRSQICL